MMGKTKAHIRYKLSNGMIVPGTTTITGQLDKPALKIWANRIGLQGIEMSKYVDDKADIGTLAHQMILDHFRGIETNTDDYSKNQIDQAENALLSFFAWEKQHKLESTVLEEPLVSEAYKFGGTCDFFGLVDGKYELLDFKTGSGIWPEFWYQVSAYAQLIFETQAIRPVKYRILNIPRTEDESFKEESHDNSFISNHWEGFKDLLNFYYHNKLAKGK